ncbi:reverse transcriptase [Senna tora]|uniref:Reverse transcriptase n=1 Tax=Senna tora TaxID=362788 RepID=A0A834W831_9FABA|nr:reverse transcriptase [Senna tora]
MIEDTFKEIHASVDVNGSPIALVSFVYGSPSRDRRKILWENLVNLSTVHNLPWLVGGDFNEILSPDEKWGVRDASLTRINDFQNCIGACGLIDLGFLGPKFTWFNKRPNGQIVFERLDRFLGRALNARPSPQLAILNQNLSNQYREILLMEEELWASKARLDWLLLGDGNTKFFLSSVINRRRKNKILGLKNNTREWVNDIGAVINLIVEYFSYCFTRKQVKKMPNEISSSINHPALSSFDCRSPDPIEIKSALWDLKPFKAAGVDGFLLGFFQRYWDTIGTSIVNHIQEGASIPGRKPIDNVVIAQDIVFRFQKKKGKTDALQLFGFPSNSLKLIHSCISSVKHQILVNGELTGNVCPGRGIRQGDPLSPYLFILAMELLSRCIEFEVARGKWKSPSVKGTRISHLLYADDVLLFVKIDKNSVLAVKKALGLFLDISVLSVNESKSSIWFSPNTISNEKDFILRTLPFRCSPKPGTYLGFPLCSGTKKRDFSEIVKRIRDKVESWKAPLLSKPWRVTLIKSVSAATANYYMQVLPFPISICKEIDKIHRNFLWGSSNGRKKIHLVQLGIHHGNLFINILYQIWLSRNNLAFSAKDINVNSYFWFGLMRAAEFSHLTVNDNNNDVFKAPILVSWISPPAGWWKINIDGSCTSLSNNIAAGGIVRDYCGNWVLGFSKFLGDGTILCAEFWAILIDLELANSAEGSKIIVESDFLAVITLINDLNTPTSHHFFLSSRVAGHS